ncbi:hypothetical protein [Streptomyces sp. NBC_01314]|nr:hypothetical protein OG622_07685 [Streptomyces sp. NBC_01314]
MSGQPYPVRLSPPAAGEAVGYITGIVLDVDGGVSIGSSIR